VLLRRWRQTRPLDLTYVDLVGLWGEEHVCRLDAELVEQLPLPVDAKQVLIQVGLPTQEPWLGSDPEFGQEGQIPKPIQVPGRSGRWCRLANDHGRNWSVAEDSGKVVLLLSLDPTVDRDCFVNSTLRVFVESLYRFALWSRATEHLSWLEQGQELVQLWNVLSGIDPPAFDDPNHVWPANLTDLGWELGWPVGWRPGLVMGHAPDG
jgi:SUKH-4 immunity protein